MLLIIINILHVVVAELLSRVWVFVTPWTAACQVSLSFTISQNLLKLMSIKSLMSSIPSSITYFCSCPQSFPASGFFPVSQLFISGGQRIWASDSASFPLMNTQDRFPLGWTSLISLQSKGLSRAFSNTPVQKHQVFSAQPSLWSTSHIRTWLLEEP